MGVEVEDVELNRRECLVLVRFKLDLECNCRIEEVVVGLSNLALLIRLILNSNCCF